QRLAEQPHAVLMREYPLERRLADRANPPAMALGMVLDRIAGLLDQLTVLHVRRAGRLTRPAAEAMVHLILERLIRLHQPVGDGFHERDAAPRRLRLDTRLAERRTGRQAEAAAHAVRQLVIVQ